MEEQNTGTEMYATQPVSAGIELPGGFLSTDRTSFQSAATPRGLIQPWGLVGELATRPVDVALGDSLAASDDRPKRWI